jgi:hypothetical protein
VHYGEIYKNQFMTIKDFQCSIDKQKNFSIICILSNRAVARLSHFVTLKKFSISVKLINSIECFLSSPIIGYFYVTSYRVFPL